MGRKIRFTTDRKEVEVIDQIVERAAKMAEKVGVKTDSLNLHMDISATHANGCPLKLEELLKADDFNFAHDIAGIQRHIDRKTGELKDCFLPRYARL